MYKAQSLKDKKVWKLTQLDHLTQLVQLQFLWETWKFRIGWLPPIASKLQQTDRDNRR